MIEVANKMCSACGVTKLRTNFHKHKRMRDGLSTICKDCNKAKAAAWYHTNIDRGRASRREHYSHNRAKTLELMAKYRLNNKEALAKGQKASREANADRKRKNDIAWHKKNPKKMLGYRKVSEHRRRAAKLLSNGQYTASQIQELHIRQKKRCVCCPDSINDRFEIDHIMPLSKGGDNSIRNIQLLCPPCNRRKSAKHPITFMQERGFLL